MDEPSTLTIVPSDRTFMLRLINFLAKEKPKLNSTKIIVGNKQQQAPDPPIMG